ncbi:Tetratricopeptide-like helical domain-containing protein [Dioscorea alata]|uniref:Tetratricopeptide-like helical domain-containing protein n=1 Tax=Dioscorea alata TaxID=55571 RepID=A0ACB7VZT3_DIOAL|nr:Tetratricopeptide-like helical domain-containing protein [Dioscorea alata]
MALRSLTNLVTPPTKNLVIILRLLSNTSAHQNHDEEKQSVSNRAYWTKRIHGLCAQDHNPDEALRLLDRLRLRGYRPDPLNIASIVHALCDLRCFADAHRRLLLSVASLCLPDDRTANVLLARLLDARTPLPTLQVLNSLIAAKPSFVPSLTNYNRLIDQLSSDSHPSEARDLMVSMKTRGRLPNAVTFTALINGFSRCGELDHARQLFDEMLTSGVIPNSLTYSVLLKGVLRQRRVEEAGELMRELWSRMALEKDSSVNSAAFANLVDALCLEGFFHEVFRIAEEMPQGKFVYEEFAYSQMIDSLCGAGKHHGASRVVYIMKKRGFFPSIVSYSCIIHGLSKEGEGGCMRAYQLFKEGIGFGYSLPEPTYKALIEGLCQEKDLDKAKDLLEFMLQKDGVDKTRIYNMFLSSLRLVDNPSEQLNVLVLMLQKQCQPDVVTLNTVIHGFCKIGRVNEAIKILDDMLSGNFAGPDVVTFTTIIGGLLEIAKPKEAVDLLHRKMPECCCTPNAVTYNVVIGGLCKLKMIDEAMEIFNEMVAKGVIADSTTYTVIIDGLFNASRLEDAKKFWDETVWPSKLHDDYVYAAIFRGLCHLGELNEACDFLYELVDCGVTPGIVSYNILIDNACKQGLKREAYQIMSEMKKNGLEPDAVTWRILDKFHEKERKAEDSGSESSSTMLEDEECGNKIEQCEDTLEGLVDPSLSNALFEDSIEDENHKVSEGIRQQNHSNQEQREPLSRIARRVFGLL